MVAGQLLAQGPHSEEVKDARPNWADSAKLQNLSQIEVFQKIDTTRNIKELSDLFEGPSSPPFLQLKYHKYLNMQVCRSIGGRTSNHLKTLGRRSTGQLHSLPRA